MSAGQSCIRRLRNIASALQIACDFSASLDKQMLRCVFTNQRMKLPPINLRRRRRGLFNIPTFASAIRYWRNGDDQLFAARFYLLDDIKSRRSDHFDARRYESQSVTARLDVFGCLEHATGEPSRATHTRQAILRAARRVRYALLTEGNFYFPARTGGHALQSAPHVVEN